MKALKDAGTAQNRKVYARHGVTAKMYGVSYADLGGLRKKIKVDLELAEKLWASGNHDARMLAAMVADPDEIRSSTLDEWARELDCYPLADAFSGLAGRTRFVDSKIARWTRSRDEFIGQAGWNLLARKALKDESAPAAFFEPYLQAIERGIGKAKNRTRYAMNNALIAIGLKNAGLERKAIAAARRLGPVEVDHGQTSCKTPDAIDYIRRTNAHRKKIRI